MADKSFGVKELNLLGSSGTPSIESPNDLNLNANTVAISTNLTVGSKLSVTSAGIVTAVSGVVTYYGDGSNLTGLAATDKIVADSLVVSGISTLGDFKFEAGIVTAKVGAAITYYGDGQYLSGTSADIPGINTTGTSTFENIIIDGNAGIGSLNVTGVSTFVGEVNIDGNILLDDPHILGFGTAGEMGYIYHNSSNLMLTNVVGDVYLTTSDNDKDIKIQTDDGSGGLANYFLADGSTGEAILYHYGTERIKTSGSGAIVSGILTATSFYGDGQYLSGIVTAGGLPGIDTTGTSTFENIIIDGNASIGSLNVTGISTFGNVVGFNSTLQAYWDVTLGTDETNFVTVNADFNSDLNPSATGTYDLGHGTGFWKTVWLHNIYQNSAGFSTFSNASFSGNVSIAGTLTYEDVTNVDSVGVVTAREGIRVGAGKSIGSDTGTVTYYGDGSKLTGVSTVGMTRRWNYINDSGDRNLFTCDAGGTYEGGSDSCYNIAAGYQAMNLMTNSTSNTGCNIALGRYAGCCSDGAEFNISIGDQSGRANTSGKHNINIGYRSGACTDTTNNNINIGCCAGMHGTGAGEGGDCNIAIGIEAAKFRCGGSSHRNIALGYQSGHQGKGTDNISLGYRALYGGVFCGSHNIGIGSDTGKTIVNADNNIFMGRSAGYNTCHGSDNIMLGRCSGYQQICGNENIFIGQNAGYNVRDGCYNTMIGHRAGVWSCNGCNNVYIGDNSGGSQSRVAYDQGTWNVSIGSSAGRCMCTAYSNALLGAFAGSTLSEGDGNVFLGAEAGDNVTTGSCNVFIGFNVQAPYATSDRQFGIGCATSYWIQGDGSYNTTISGIATVYAATGVVSATSFYGDGSNLTGVGAATNIDGITVQEESSNVGTAGSITILDFQGANVTATASGSNKAVITVDVADSLWVSNDTGIHTTSNVGIGTTTNRSALLTLSAPPDSTNDLIVMSAAGAASTERITIGSTTSDNGAISFEGSEGTLLSITNNLSSGSIFSVNDISGIPSIDVDADGTILFSPLASSSVGNVGVGTTNPSTRLHVEGNVKVTGVVTATDFDSTSDIRLKTNIKPIDDPLAKVVQIEGVSFNWKQDNRPALGVIADQIEKVIPELVHGDDPKTVNYNGLVGLLIEVVKDQQTQIDDLNKRLSKLE